MVIQGPFGFHVSFSVDFPTAEEILDNSEPNFVVISKYETPVCSRKFSMYCIIWIAHALM